MNKLIYDHFETKTVHLEIHYALIFEYHKIEPIVIKLKKLRKILLKKIFDAHYFCSGGILRSINATDKIYKNIVKMDVNENAQYNSLKKNNIFKIHYVEVVL